MGTRTPRNYSGTLNPVKKVADLLPSVKDQISRKVKLPNEEVFQFWNELLGKTMAPLTEPISFVEETLTVKVKSSTLYSLLIAHEKARLLRELQKKFSIRNIVFRVG